MKIIHLTAENVKKLKAVEITPTGAIVQVTGKNGAGKSSVLDSIFYALAGGKALPKEPIRRGEKSAHIKLDLGEIIVTRKFSEGGGTSLVVEGTNGARFSSPQRMLDEMLGAISFDPLAFSRMEPKKQLDTLRQVSKLDVDLDALAGKNKTDYETRTEVNRSAKALRAQADGVTVPADLPDEPIDISALLADMEKASTHNAAIERRKATLESATALIAANRRKVEELETGIEAALNEIDREAKGRVDELQAQIQRIKDRAAADRDTLRNTTNAKAEELRQATQDLQATIDDSELPAPIDTASVRLQIEQARTVNAGIEKRTQRKRLEEQAEAQEARSKDLTLAIEARDQVKADAIAKAKLPIADISFGDDQVLYKGIPFDQASSADQLRASVAIAMAANPKLRVLRIKDGGLLDEDSMQLLREMTEAADYQVWIETVHANGPVAVEMVDGAAKGADVEAKPSPAAQPTKEARADGSLL